MRGKDEQQLDVFSYVSPEQRVPQDHPLRSLRAGPSGLIEMDARTLPWASTISSARPRTTCSEPLACTLAV